MLSKLEKQVEKKMGPVVVELQEVKKLMKEQNKLLEKILHNLK